MVLTQLTYLLNQFFTYHEFNVGDIDRPLLIEIFDWNKDGRHKSMGSVQSSVRGLLQSQGAAMNVIGMDLLVSPLTQSLTR